VTPSIEDVIYVSIYHSSLVGLSNFFLDEEWDSSIVFNFLIIIYLKFTIKPHRPVGKIVIDILYYNGTVCGFSATKLL